MLQYCSQSIKNKEFTAHTIFFVVSIIKHSPDRLGSICTWKLIRNNNGCTFFWSNQLLGIDQTWYVSVAQWNFCLNSFHILDFSTTAINPPPKGMAEISKKVKDNEKFESVWLMHCCSTRFSKSWSSKVFLKWLSVQFFSILMIISNFSYNLAAFGGRWLVEWQ